MAENSQAQFSGWLADARKAYDTGDMHRAESLYRMVIAVDDKHVDALRMVGLLIAQRGHFDEGLSYVDKAIAVNPSIGRLYFFRGNILEGTQRFEEALIAYDRCVAVEPAFLQAYIHRGIIFGMLGRLHESRESFDKAIELAPQQPEAYYNRANTLQSLQRYEDAVADYEKTIELAPGFAPAYNNLGTALKELGQVQEALSNYQRAIGIDPTDFHAYNNMGVAFHALNRPHEALASYDKTLSFSPNYAQVYNNKGITLQQLHRYDEALGCFEKAFELNPFNAEACNNKAYIFQEMRQYELALLWYDKAIEIQPDYVDAHWNKSLLLGDYEKGLAEFEWRWKKPDAIGGRLLVSPPWFGGESLTAKTIFLHAEQGLGDMIQYCRYVDLVRNLGANVVLEVPRTLQALMTTLRSRPVVIAKEDTTQFPDHHCHSSLLSLPVAFGTRVDTIPAHTPYLFADAIRRAAWRDTLGPHDKLRVGIAWSGNATHKNNHNRSIHMSEFGGLFAGHENIDFHVLQKEIGLLDYSVLRKHDVATHVTELDDFADTAALIAELDLVIAVDTSIAHLAGALGKTVWILLPYAPDYRWLTDRKDSPWYPTATLFRQPAPQSWPAVIAQVSLQLGTYPKPDA